MSALCFFVPDVVTKRLQEQAVIELKSMAARNEDAGLVPVAQRKERIATLHSERDHLATQAAGLAAKIGEIRRALGLE